MKQIIEYFICPVCQQHLSTTPGFIHHLRSRHTFNEEQINIERNKIQDFQTKSDTSKRKKLAKPFIERYGKDKTLEIIKKRKQTCIQKYGTECQFQNDQVLQKTKSTNLQRYGVENVSESKTIRKKAEQTLFENYGVRIPFQSDLIKTKIKLTNMQNLGVENPFESKLVQDKIKQTCLKKYGVDNVFKLNDIKHQTSLILKGITYERLLNNRNDVVPMFTFDEYVGTNNKYTWKCKKCNTIFEKIYDDGILPKCPKCYPKIESLSQLEIANFLKSHQIQILTNDRSTISPLELDVYCQDKHLAIEYNGIHWHSERVGKKRNYHLIKTELCKNKDIRLIHIFEDEWMNKKRIVLSRLRNIFGLNRYKIHGRKCEIKLIDHNIAMEFVDKYHIQSHGNCHLCYGAYYKNRLIAVMTFCKKRLALGNRKPQVFGHYELERFCTIPNVTIHGIANKILSQFEIDYKPVELITYADRRWSEGGLYEKLGFTLDHISGPNYWYIDQSISPTRIHRFNFRKNVLKDKLSIFDPNLTEWQNMQANGYDRIWDCGNLVFKKKYNIT